MDDDVEYNYTFVNKEFAGKLGFAKPQIYLCPKHGEHDATMNIHIYGKEIEAHYCLHCMMDKFDEIGVNRMERVK